ncbi:MAG: pitrilysin family protein, partial [Candidatus Woesearchaeota archaeon]|nr:pitrilysin family protein [Candidatus Woesearchaeota archaeon]
MKPLYDNRYLLENGLQIYSKQKSDKNRIAFHIVINSGAANDPIDKHGLSHLLEHLIFKIKGYTEATLAEFCDFNGIDFNAGTGHDEITIFFNFLPEKLDVVLELAKSFLTDNNYTQKDIKHEINGPIKSEILDDNISPEYIFGNFVHNYLYDNTKYKGNILGTIESLKNIKVQDLDDYKNIYFTAKNMFFYLEGDFKNIQLEQTISKYFSNLNSGIKYDNTIDTKREQQDVIYLKNKSFEGQNIISLIHTFEDIEEEDIFKLALIKNILTQGFTSLLINRLRTKHKLIYGCFSDTNYKFKDCYYNIIIPNIEIDNTQKIIDIINQTTKELKNDLIDDKFFNGKKTHFKFIMEEYFDDIHSRIAFLTFNIYFRQVNFEKFENILDN